MNFKRPRLLHVACEFIVLSTCPWSSQLLTAWSHPYALKTTIAAQADRICNLTYEKLLIASPVGAMLIIESNWFAASACLFVNKFEFHSSASQKQVYFLEMVYVRETLVEQISKRVIELYHSLIERSFNWIFIRSRNEFQRLGCPIWSHS